MPYTSLKEKCNRRDAQANIYNESNCSWQAHLATVKPTGRFQEVIPKVRKIWQVQGEDQKRNGDDWGRHKTTGEVKEKAKPPGHATVHQHSFQRMEEKKAPHRGKLYDHRHTGSS